MDVINKLVGFFKAFHFISRAADGGCIQPVVTSEDGSEEPTKFGPEGNSDDVWVDVELALKEKLLAGLGSSNDWEITLDLEGPNTPLISVTKIGEQILLEGRVNEPPVTRLRDVLPKLMHGYEEAAADANVFYEHPQVGKHSFMWPVAPSVDELNSAAWREWNSLGGNQRIPRMRWLVI